MWGAKPLAIVLVLSTLSACAGSGRQPDVATAPAIPPSDSYAETVDLITESEDDRRLAAAAELDAAQYARRDHRDRRYPGRHRHHHHDEPGPEAQQAAETALLLMGSAFLCTFVVVVLDGGCNFGVHAGYYY